MKMNTNGRALVAGLILAMLALVAGGVYAQRTMTTSNIIRQPTGPDGWQVGEATTDKIGFHDKAPTTQRSDASQVAITDSTGGTVSDTFAAGNGVYALSFGVNLANIADGDVITSITPTHKFKVLETYFVTNVPVTTGSKASTLNWEIGTTNLTGGTIALTSAACTPMGKVVPGAPITAANTGSASQLLSLEAASTTAFVEGSGTVVIVIQNMDTADSMASVADKWNELRTTLVNKGLIKGSS